MHLAVCIPIHNEADRIVSLLEKILQVIGLLPSFTVEVFLYFDGCSDNSLELVSKRFGGLSNFKIFSSFDRRGKISAINQLSAVVLESKCITHVLLMDSDIDFNVLGLTSFLEGIPDAIGLRVPRNLPNRSCGGILSRWSILCSDALCEFRARESAESRLWAVSGNLMLFDSQAFRVALPLPDRSIINDDYLVGWRLHKAGIDILYCPQLEVEFRSPRSFVQFIRQKFRVRKGFSQLARLGMPVAEMRSSIIALALKRIIATRQYTLLPMLALDVFLAHVASLVPARQGDVLWKRVPASARK